jgi:RNA polymerase sigma-B factor
LKEDVANDRALLEYGRTGSRRARDAAVERYIPLARSLARRYRRGSEPLEDLEQVAYLALIKAVDAFDASHHTAFSSYAVPCITGALKRHFRDHGWAVRVPRELQELALRVNRVVDELSAQTGRSPTPAEVAEVAGIDVEDVLNAREVPRGAHAGRDRPAPRVLPDAHLTAAAPRPRPAPALRGGRLAPVAVLRDHELLG